MQTNYPRSLSDSAPTRSRSWDLSVTSQVLPSPKYLLCVEQDVKPLLIHSPYRGSGLWMGLEIFAIFCVKFDCLGAFLALF